MLRSMLCEPRHDLLGTALLDLLTRLRALRTAVCQRATQRLHDIMQRTGHRPDSHSAHNLAHYLALREHDLRELQQKLAQVGLSSLGRGEAHVLDNMDAVITLLERATGNSHDPVVNLAPEDPNEPLRRNSRALFGKPSGQRRESIMVTLPREAAADRQLLRDLLLHGMDCARINCAHDDHHTWQRMIDNLQHARRELKRPCRLLMDLAGHKIRTGPLATEDPVRHLRVHRDNKGHVLQPAEVLLLPSCPDHPGTIDGRTCLPVPNRLLQRLEPGVRLVFRDCRGKKRQFRVIEPHDGGWLVHLHAGAYVCAGTRLALIGVDGKQMKTRFRLGRFSGESVRIRLFRNDLLRLTRNGEPGQPERHNDKGKFKAPAQISCSHPEVLQWLKPGDSVWFDDGKLGTRVVAIDECGALLEVTEAGMRGVRLQAGKGINFPQTELQLPSLSEEDLDALPFICQHADMVGFSFVQRLTDMDELIEHLKVQGRPELAIIAKIETAAAVRNLPEILLGTLDRHRLGVMIARGDLAVELGSVRMAEIQEEILWLCEAAHVPAIWATQVLESLAKQGVSSRPEITDAAMSVRAECVMLNKGPYIVDALRVLGDILARMDAHQEKKVSRLRALHW